MKKAAVLILSMLLLLSCVACKKSDTSELSVYQDTTLKPMTNVFQSLTLYDGVTLTTKYNGDPQVIEIHGSLMLGRDAKIVGEGILKLFRGSSCLGMDLYYCYDGEYRLLPDLEEVFESRPDAEVLAFTYQTGASGWVWNEEITGSDPFAAEPLTASQRAETYAKALNVLGLMQSIGRSEDGTRNYELNQPLTRAQTVVMLLRLLGKGGEAVNSEYSHPFTDLYNCIWAEQYIAYAYQNGFVSGTSDTEFGSEEDASAAMYLTFLLRAMGYDDHGEAPDFTYQESPRFARSLGIDLNDEEIENFCRAEAIAASFLALRSPCKDGEPLYRHLSEQGLFTEEEYWEVMEQYGGE